MLKSYIDVTIFVKPDNWINGRCSSQLWPCASTSFLIICKVVLTWFSAIPLPRGWYGVTRRWSIFMFVDMIFIILLTNSLPLSDWIILGKPIVQNNSQRAVTTVMPSLFWRARRKTNRVQTSTTTSSRTFLFLVIGNGPARSMATCSPGKVLNKTDQPTKQNAIHFLWWRHSQNGSRTGINHAQVV